MKQYASRRFNNSDLCSLIELYIGPEKNNKSIEP